MSRRKTKPKDNVLSGVALISFSAIVAPPVNRKWSYLFLLSSEVDSATSSIIVATTVLS